MKHQFLLCLASVVCLPFASMCDEIRVSSVDMPDDVKGYCIDDLDNSGRIPGPQQEYIGFNEGAMQIGDVDNPDVADRVRKEFLLFHLPSLGGNRLTHATLRLYLAEVRHEAAEKPLPPAWLFHAEKWADESWLSDSTWHGLRTSHFADNETFSQKIALCHSDDKPDFIELDVTGMIRSDYLRSKEPVAAFRLEISDHKALDITDRLMNAYIIHGPGMLSQPTRLPMLVLSYE